MWELGSGNLVVMSEDQWSVSEFSCQMRLVGPLLREKRVVEEGDAIGARLALVQTCIRYMDANLTVCIRVLAVTHADVHVTTDGVSACYLLNVLTHIDIHPFPP